MCSRQTDSNYVRYVFYRDTKILWSIFTKSIHFSLDRNSLSALLAIARFSNPCQHQLTHKWLLHLDQQLTGHTDGSQVERFTQVDPQTKLWLKLCTVDDPKLNPAKTTE